MDAQTLMEALYFARGNEDGYRFEHQIIEINKLKIEELKYFAKQIHIKGYHKMRKPELIEILRDKV